MRALYLGLAAALCLLAIGLQLFDISDLIALVCLLAAGIFLVLALKITAASRPAEPLVLDDEKEATLRAMLDRGDEGAAVRQVQMWFRDAGPEQARAVVQGLK